MPVKQTLEYCFLPYNSVGSAAFAPASFYMIYVINVYHLVNVFLVCVQACCQEEEESITTD